MLSDIRYFNVRQDRDIIVDVYQRNSGKITLVGKIRADRLHLPENVIGIQLGTDINSNVFYSLYKKSEAEPFFSGGI
ncbi:hypothetical protein [Desulfonema magnum]|uniref:Uncharacterized protein n=1 Tax=Desulfonema magnum TaxID=45655 RepID=A0A975BSH7_9BACT|nr:hypothetical protein [Desulfonema magnum]QTA90785.1 Uncharacterized protein dnm_068460 [Desulfonema magnum]